MNRLTLGALVLAASLFALTTDTRGAAPFRAGNDTQQIIYLSDSGPLLIRLHLYLDGRPFRRAWEELLDELFAYLDVNRDGVLSKEEAKATPPAAAFAGSGGLFARGGGPVAARTRAELARHYRQAGLAPFQISTSPRQDGVIRLLADGSIPGQSSSAEQLNARLFELLDRDRDGKLTTTELAATPAILGKLDTDEDEMLTAEELRGRVNRRGDEAQQLAIFDTAASLQGNSGPFRAVGDGPADPALAKALLARYGKKGATTLDAQALGLSKERFAALDRDGNGKLDEEELARVEPWTPDVELTVRLGKRDKQPLVELVRCRPGFPARVTANDQSVALELGTVTIELRGPEGSANGFVIDAKVQYTTQFRMADRDNNGYLDRAEAEKSPLFSSLFAVMDRDGDGMLYEKEVLAYVARMERLRQRASNSCVTLVVTDQGKGLFEMIDADGDGRLSVRELRRMIELVKRLDRDGDSKLARGEVPRRFRGAFERGPAGGGGGLTRVVFFAGGMGGGPRLPERTAGPLWFRKMDRNRDGDVSRKEFLGTEEAFRTIDTDGDGLISADEADRYDAARRKK